MYFLIYPIYLTLGTSPMISCTQAPEPINSTSETPAIVTSQGENIPNPMSANLSMKVELLPYEILDRQATSHADISLTLSNTSQKNIEVEVKKIDIVTAGTAQVLMSSTPQELGLPTKIALDSGEKRIVEYRLQSLSKLYQQGQDVIAQILYRGDDRAEHLVKSTPEAVAFTIP